MTQALSTMEAATARLFARHRIKTPAPNICQGLGYLPDSCHPPKAPVEALLSAQIC